MSSNKQSTRSIHSDLNLQGLDDCNATRRALDFYLKAPVAVPDHETAMFCAQDTLSLEEAVLHASDLLRCSIATAQASAETLQGAQRALAHSSVYMMEMAKVFVDKAIDTQQLSRK